MEGEAGQSRGPGVEIGRRIRAAREHGMFTRRELSARSGVSEQGIAAVEMGRVARPHRRTLEGIAQGLGISVEALLVGNAPIPASPGPDGGSPGEFRARAEAEADRIRAEIAAGTPPARVTPDRDPTLRKLSLLDLRVAADRQAELNRLHDEEAIGEEEYKRRMVALYHDVAAELERAAQGEAG